MCPSSTSSSDPHADEGLIGEPLSLAGQPLRRGLALFVCGLFVVSLLGTVLYDTVFPAPEKKPLGAEAVVFAREVAAANVWDGSSARLFERKLQNRSSVREVVTNSYGYFLYRYMGLVRPTVLLGDEGWLFLKSRARLDHTIDNAPVVVACALAAMERTLALADIQVVSVCIPRKALLYRDKLPRGVALRADLDQRLSEELRIRGVSGPDLMRVYENNNTGRVTADESKRALYMITDSHWAPRAEYLAARATSKAAGLQVPRAQRRGTFIVKPHGPIGRDLVHYAGLNMTEQMTEYLQLRRAESWQLVSKQGKPLVLNGADASARIVVCGTSFTARREFSNFLGHFCGQIVHNAAQLGGDPTEQLWKLLSAGERPKVVVMEYPNHSLFHPTIMRNAGNIYGALEFGELPVVIGSQDLPLLPRHIGQTIQTPGFRPPVATNVTGVVHSGDGVLAWRLRGESLGAGVTLRSGVRPAPIEEPWVRGDREILVPIIAAGPVSGAAPVLLRSNPGNKKRGRARIDSVELVMLASEERTIALELGQTGSIDGDWYQDLSTSPGERLPKHAVLDLNLEFSEVGPHVLTIEVWAETEVAQPSFRQRVTGVTKETRVCFSLSAFAGQSLLSIRIRASNAAGTATISNPRILGAAND